MNKKVLALAVIVVMAFSLTACSGAEKAPDYSSKECWYKFPDITKDVDTFYVYATEYMGLEEGLPDYAALDNEEMVKGVEGQYLVQASAYEECSNVLCRITVRLV